MKASTVGSCATNWSCCHDARANPEPGSVCLVVWRAFIDRVGPVATGSLRTDVSAIENRRRENFEGNAVEHGRTPSGNGWIRTTWRTPARSLRTRLLSSRGAGHIDCFRRIGRSGQHKSDRVVLGSVVSPLRLPVVEFEWPP